MWLNVVGIFVCLPALGIDLHANETGLQWIADVYTVLIAALLLPAGAAIDRFGRRRGLIVGQAAMAAGQLVSATASSSSLMLTGRVVAGVAAAVVFPATLASISAALPDERRDRAVGIWAAGVILGSLAGFLAAVVVLQFVSWRWVFVTMVASTIVCLAASALAIPETREPRPGRADLTGMVLSAVAVGGLVTGVIEGPVQGWTALVVLVPFVASVVAGVAFVRVELTTADPLLDLRMFRNRELCGCALALTFIFAVDFGLFFLAFQLFAAVFRYGPIKTALLFGTAGVTMLPATFLAPRIAARLGLRTLLTGAVLLCAVGAATMAAIDRSGPILLLLGGLWIFYAGVGAAMTPATRGILDALPSSEQGSASALNDLTRELGAAVGVALLGSLFTVGYRHGVGGLSHSLVNGPLRVAVRASPASAIAAVSQVSAVHEVQGAVAGGWRLALLVGAGALVVAAAILAVSLPGRSVVQPFAELPPLPPRARIDLPEPRASRGTPAGAAVPIGAGVLVLVGLGVVVRQLRGAAAARTSRQGDRDTGDD